MAGSVTLDTVRLPHRNVVTTGRSAPTKAEPCCCGCMSRPLLYNNVVLTFLLIVALGLLAGMSLGGFILLKPLFERRKISLESLNNSSLQEITSRRKGQHGNQIVQPVLAHRSDGEVDTTSNSKHPNQYFLNFQTSRSAKIDLTSTTPAFSNSYQELLLIDNIPEHTSYSTTQHSSAMEDITELIIGLNQADVDIEYDSENSARPGSYMNEINDPQPVLQRFGEVIGISYREGYLYVPSYQTGHITILTTPDLTPIRKYECNGCSIYDIAILSTGDMILSQGGQKIISKMNPNGKILSEIEFPFSLRGLSVSKNDEIIAVVSASHHSVQIFNSDLQNIGSFLFPRKSRGDCNFVAVNSTGAIFVGCQNGVYSFDAGGNFNYILEPPRGVSYDAGIAIDESNKIMVVRKGQGVLDIFDSSGVYVETVDAPSDASWADICVGDGYLYAVDYRETMIKVFKYS